MFFIASLLVNKFILFKLFALSSLHLYCMNKTQNKDFGAGSQTDLTRGLVSSAAQARKKAYP